MEGRRVRHCCIPAPGMVYTRFLFGIPAVMKVDENGHEGNTAAVTAYFMLGETW